LFAAAFVAKLLSLIFATRLKTAVLQNDSPSLAPDSELMTSGFTDFLKRFDKGPPVGNASRV